MEELTGRYFLGDVGRSGGKLHFFPEDAETGRAVLSTACSVEWRVGTLLRDNVDEEMDPQEPDALEEEHGDAICRNCLRRA